MDWVPTISPQAGPLYRQIAEAIEGDIVSGRLRRGQQLPTHRALAQALGIDLTTVTRAYAEARGRGLLEGRVGQGTFVSESSLRPSTLTTDVIDVDLSMNVPPQPAEAALDSRIAQGLAAIERRAGFSPFLNYQRPGGGEAELEQTVQWLAPRLVGLSTERMAIFPGSQSAIFSVLRFLCRPGDRVLTEALTFPGFRSAAQTLGLTVAGVAMDGEGAVPDALAKAIRAHRPKAVYLTPTMHNPSTATMSARRRWDIAQILRKTAIPLIEDDAYGLLDRSQDLIATLIPDQTFVTTSLSKCLTPGLRVSFLTAPDAASATGLRGILQSIAHMAPPLMVALVMEWLKTGDAETIILAIKKEAGARQDLAARILRGHAYSAHPNGHHVWMPLPQAWSRMEFVAQLFRRGLSVVPSDAFAVDAPPQAIRLGLGAARTREDLASALTLLAATLRQSGGIAPVV
ncbi:MAG TPA: PLP-dependent aminotransferase family protein [Roseiarcus sp.]|nr:PLP-dependent aminotransferase family protein [Roseiarcus sp.]